MKLIEIKIFLFILSIILSPIMDAKENLIKLNSINLIIKLNNFNYERN